MNLFFKKWLDGVYTIFPPIFITDFSPPVWYHCFVSFNHLLLIVNASCNFLIYVSVGDKFKTTIDNFCYSILGCKKRQGSPESLATEKDKIEAFEEGDDEDENEKVAIPLVNKTTKNDTQTGDQQKNGTAKTNHDQVLMHVV